MKTAHQLRLPQKRSGQSHSKYHNKKTEVDGITFDSQAEANYYLDLKILKRAGVVKYIGLQPEFPLVPDFTYKNRKFRGAVYRADFQVEYADGHTEIVDVKGVRTQEYKLKKKLLLWKYNDINFVEVDA